MTPARRALAAGLAFAIALALLGAYVALRFEVTTDIAGLLPEADRQTAALSRRLADSALSRTHVITIGPPADTPGDTPPDPTAAVAAARALEAALRADPALTDTIAHLQGGPPPELERALYALYHPRRFLLGDPAPLTGTALRAAADRLKAELARPTSALTSRLAPSDPLLTLLDLFETAAPRDGVTLHDGRFVTADRRHAVLLLTTAPSAFDAAAQAPLLAAIDRHFTAIRAALDPPLVLESSAVARYAVRAEAAIKADIQRVSTLSLIGLALLLALLFQSPRLILLTALPLGAGVLAGCALTLALFGRIHGITLAFGASLIGVAIDYVIHLYAHHAARPDPRTAEHLWPTLRTGALTTAVGFVALALTPFVALREVAAFATAGVLTALLATRYIVPLGLPAAPRPVRLRAALLRALARLYPALRRRRRGLALIPLAALALCALALPRLEFQTDFTQMNRLDPALAAQDHRVRARITRFEQTRFVAALAPDDAAALDANDRAAAILDAAVAAGELGGYQSAAALLPGPARQRAALARYTDPTLYDRFAAAYTAAGFRPHAFAPFRAALDAPPPALLRWPDLEATPLASILRPLRVELDDGTLAWLTFLRDVRDPAALAARFEATPQLTYLDQTTVMRETNTALQHQTARLLAIGLAAVLLLLALRYRDLRRTLAAYLPAVLGAATTLAALALLGLGLDLIALTALLMVVSMGVDYGVFLVDAHDHHDLAPALLSVALACASTVLGFGLLALSDHPVLHTIGVTAGVGVLTCLVLSPTALALLGREADS